MQLALVRFEPPIWYTMFFNDLPKSKSILRIVLTYVLIYAVNSTYPTLSLSTVQRVQPIYFFSVLIENISAIIQRNIHDLNFYSTIFLAISGC